MNVTCSYCGVVHNCDFCPNCGTPATPEMKNCKYCQSQIHKKAIVCPFCRRRQKVGAFSIILIIFLPIIIFFSFYSIINNFREKIDRPIDKTTTLINSDESKQKAITNPATEKPEELILKIGDTIKSDSMEVTINKIEFSYDVLPDDISGFYTHYEADSGKIYIHIDTDVKNLAKQNLNCDKIMTVKADYNKGYIYKGLTVPEDAITGLTYASIATIDPLETLGIRFIIECPEEVVDSDNSLFLTIQLHGTKDIYKYTIR